MNTFQNRVQRWYKKCVKKFVKKIKFENYITIFSQRGNRLKSSSKEFSNKKYEDSKFLRIMLFLVRILKIISIKFLKVLDFENRWNAIE